MKKLNQFETATEKELRDVMGGAISGNLFGGIALKYGVAPEYGVMLKYGVAPKYGVMLMYGISPRYGKDK